MRKAIRKAIKEKSHELEILSTCLESMENTIGILEQELENTRSKIEYIREALGIVSHPYRQNQASNYWMSMTQEEYKEQVRVMQEARQAVREKAKQEKKSNNL